MFALEVEFHLTKLLTITLASLSLFKVTFMFSNQIIAILVASAHLPGAPSWSHLPS